MTIPNRQLDDVAIEKVTGLVAALAGKSSSAHGHAIADVTGLQSALDAKAGDTATTAALALKANAADVTALLDAKAPLAHTHTIADVIALQAALDAKSATGHVHSAADITTGTFTVARGGTGLAALGVAGTVLRVNAAGAALEYRAGTGWSSHTQHDEFLSGAGGIGTTGALGWYPIADIGAGTTTALAGTASHPGQQRLTTGAVSGNNYSLLRNGIQGTCHLLNEFARWAAVVRPDSITAVTMNIGLGNSRALADVGTDAVIFAFDPAVSAKWRTISKAAGVLETTVTTAANVVAGNWYLLEVVRDPATGYLYFYINTVLVATHTVRLPTAAADFLFKLTTNEAVAKSLTVDFFSLESVTYTQRWT